MKKIVSIFLAASIFASMIVPALAYDQKEAISGLSKLDVVRMEAVGHGEFRLSNEPTFLSTKDAIDVERAGTGDAVFAETTSDDDILRVSVDKYLVKAYDNTYILTDKININTNDFAKKYI